MARPSMEREYEKSLPTLKDSRSALKENGANRYLTAMDRDIVILWGLYRRWSAPYIAKLLLQTPDAIRRRRDSLIENPMLVFQCPVLGTSLKFGKLWYECGFCGQMLESGSAQGKLREEKARRHILAHIMSQDILSRTEVMTGL